VVRNRNAFCPLISVHPSANVVDEATALVQVYQPYVYVIGWVPEKVPAFPETVAPARIEAGTVGGAKLSGADGGSCTAVDVAENLVTTPATFVAVSATRRNFPTSPRTGVYVKPVSPPINAQPDGARLEVDVLADPDRLHWYHETVTVGSGVPRHEPALMLSGVPTLGDAATVGSEVMLARAGCTIVTLALTGDAA
jgi:hypothetical protein